MKCFLQQKGSQLHNVLARILLLFPAFYLLPRHTSLQLFCPSPLRTRGQGLLSLSGHPHITFFMW